MSFPTATTDGQVATVNNITYQWSTATTTWTRLATAAPGTAVTSIVAGTGTYINTSTGAVTVWVTTASTFNTGTLVAQAVTAQTVGTLTNLIINGQITTPVGSNANLLIDPDGTADVIFSTSTQLLVYATNTSTSTTTGAIVVTGGLGVGGTVTANKFVGDGSSLTNVTVSQANNIVGIQPNVTLVAGSYSYLFDNTGTFWLPNIQNAYINSVYPNGNIVLNPNGTGDVVLTPNTQLYVQDATQSTSTNTGAAVITGGIGIGGNVYAGTIYSNGYALSTATSWNGGTVSNVSTFTNNLTVNGTLTRSGNVSAAPWGASGVGFTLPAATYTDNVSSGSVVSSYIHSIAVPTIASTSATSIGTAVNLYIAGDPIGSANATVTAANSYSLWVGGKTYFGGTIKVGSILSQGGAANITTGVNGPTLNGTTNITGITSVTNATNSTATNTGALVVSGGVGIASNVYVGGYVVQQTLPAFRVYGNTGGVNAGTTLTNSHFIVDYNQGGYLNTSTGIFTAPVAGIYQVNLVGRANSNAGAVAQLAAVKTFAGTTTNVVACMIEWAANTTINHTGASTAIKLAVGDTLQAKVLLGTINFDANDNFSVAFLG